jgi:histidyl-tRNA synthetase
LSRSTDRRPFNVRPVERVRGVYDRLPQDQSEIETLRSRLSQVVQLHDYRIVETPIVEHTELFMRKSGGERLAQIYAFNHRGRDLALRPEHTASIVRAYIDHMQSEPLPLRLAYCGPVFRYEKPQAGRSRQFTEFGCELIGAGGTYADAEIIRLALETMRASGIARPHIVLGHIGIVAGFLAGLNIDERAQDWLIWTMERLRDNHDSEVEIPEYLVRPPAGSDSFERLDHLDRAGVITLLQQSGVEFEGLSRTPEEIVSGLFEQRQRRYDHQVLDDALEFVKELTLHAGPPDRVLGSLRELAASRGISSSPLDEIEEIIGLLRIDQGDEVTVTVDLGMGRGLRYYTGMLFEIYATEAGQQICGGGRYDDLAQVLGARSSIEACGFSMGLERTVDAGVSQGKHESLRRAFIWTESGYAAGVKAAAELRKDGWNAAVDPRQRSESAARRSAQRHGYDAFVRVKDGSVELVHLRSGDEPKSVNQNPNEAGS